MKILKGKVISNSMFKTIVVLVVRYLKHLSYKKYILRSTKYYVHDEYNLSNKNDIVLIEYFRPISKKKCWRLIEILYNDTSPI